MMAPAPDFAPTMTSDEEGFVIVEFDNSSQGVLTQSSREKRGQQDSGDKHVRMRSFKVSLLLLLLRLMQTTG